ncbi:MAG TPA: DUF721 domain-containing protein [Candidatus Anoxymicrobiaceae bacterium]
MSNPEKIGSIISQGSVRGHKRGRHSLDLLVVNWTHLAGERLALHSKPTRLARGVLTVATDSPAWAAELSVESERLLRRIVAIVGQGTVKKVKVQSRGKRAAGPEAAGARPGEREADEVQIEGKIGDDIMALKDSEMRLALAKLVRAIKLQDQGKQADR